MKARNVFFAIGMGGILLAIGAYGYGDLIGYPNTGALVYIGFSLGGILGYFSAPYVFGDRKRVVPPVVPSPSKPVEIYWKDPERKQVTSVCKLTTVTDAEFKEVASKVIFGGTNLTYRALADVLDKNTIANFQGELIDRRLARWRKYDEFNKPIPQQGIELTEKGHRVMVESLKQSPSPPSTGWRENTTYERTHTNEHAF